MVKTTGILAAAVAGAMAASSTALAGGDAPQPMAVPEGGWPPDEFTGKGGSYVRDPITGVRTPTPETAAALAAAAAQA